MKAIDQFSPAERSAAISAVELLRLEYQQLGPLTGGNSELGFIAAKAFEKFHVVLPTCYLSVDELLLDLQGQLFAGDPDARFRREWRLAITERHTDMSEAEWIASARRTANGGVVSEPQAETRHAPQPGVYDRFDTLPVPRSQTMTVVELERERCSALMAIGALFKLSEKEITRLIEDGMSAATARAQCMKSFAQKQRLTTIEPPAGKSLEPAERFRREYQAFAEHVDCTEEQYVAACLRTLEQADPSGSHA